MNERINFARLRADLVAPFPNEVRALVETAEAAHALATHLLEKADYSPDDAELLWPLDAALERFDFTKATDRE